MAKSTRITIETDSLLFFRGRSSSRQWCMRCGAEVEMIVLDRTAVLSSLLAREVDQWLSSGNLHGTRSPDGATLICLDSLLAHLGNRQPK